jgi:hypothetical protein
MTADSNLKMMTIRRAAAMKRDVNFLFTTAAGEACSFSEVDTAADRARSMREN